MVGSMKREALQFIGEWFTIVTGPAIPIGNGKHIHFAKGRTTLNDGHVHNFEFSTLIQNPLI